MKPEDTFNIFKHELGFLVAKKEGSQLVTSSHSHIKPNLWKPKRSPSLIAFAEVLVVRMRDQQRRPLNCNEFKGEPVNQARAAEPGHTWNCFSKVFKTSTTKPKSGWHMAQSHFWTQDPCWFCSGGGFDGDMNYCIISLNRFQWYRFATQLMRLNKHIQIPYLNLRCAFLWTNHLHDLLDHPKYQP